MHDQLGGLEASLLKHLSRLLLRKIVSPRAVLANIEILRDFMPLLLGEANFGHVVDPIVAEKDAAAWLHDGCQVLEAVHHHIRVDGREDEDEQALVYRS